MLTDESIRMLEKHGFRRWTKGPYDRMYINASDLGLTLTYYKTGNVSSAYLGETRLSNSEGRRLKASKTYIDLTTDSIVSDSPILAAEVAKLLKIDYHYGDLVIPLRKDKTTR